MWHHFVVVCLILSLTTNRHWLYQRSHVALAENGIPIEDHNFPITAIVGVYRNDGTMDKFIISI